MEILTSTSFGQLWYLYVAFAKYLYSIVSISSTALYNTFHARYFIGMVMVFYTVQLLLTAGPADREHLVPLFTTELPEVLRRDGDDYCTISSDDISSSTDLTGCNKRHYKCEVFDSC